MHGAKLLLASSGKNISGSISSRYPVGHTSQKSQTQTLRHVRRYVYSARAQRCLARHVYQREELECTNIILECFGLPAAAATKQLFRSGPKVTTEC
jgi:hypothetical protein